MKKIISLVTSILTTLLFFGQTPEKMSFQAVIKDVNNNLVLSQQIGMRISILQNSPSGSAVYVESHNTFTNSSGLVSVEIGSGTVISGNFTTIDWANDTYYIQTETDPTGGSNYNITGISQLMSVPYALHAKTAESIIGGTSDDFYLGQDTLGGIVYYVYQDATGQQHGLIVNKTESSAAWQTTSSVTGADRSWDGAFNTSVMVNSPAANYVNSIGTGWYLPSVDEMNLLWNNRFTTNEALILGGFTPLPFEQPSVYWTSTERDHLYAINFRFRLGYPTGPNSTKTVVYRVRAVKAF